jgi:hypothetical protein
MKPILRIEHAQVQTINWCNRSCPFCPSNTFDLEKETMSGATYARILEGLGSINFRGRFSPYLMNEPLLDSRLPDLIAQAREALPDSTIVIQTNGDLLTRKVGARLFSKGLHKMIVNCYDLTPERRQKLQEIVTELAESVPGLQKVGYGLNLMVHPGRKDRRRLEISLQARNGLNSRSLSNRAGNLPRGKVLMEPLQRSCLRPFRQLYFRFNGDAVLCCCDWKGEVVLGNINTTAWPKSSTAGRAGVTAATWPTATGP